MNQENRIFTSEVISIQHYHGNIIYSNHGNGTQQNKDFKVFKMDRVNDLILLSMAHMMTTCLYGIEYGTCLYDTVWY